MLSVRNIAKTIGPFALREVSFDVDTGDYFVLLGVSGVGKSVLMEILAGVTPAARGSIFLDGVDITRAPMQHRNMAAVFQDPALFPHMTVARNIAYGLHGRNLSRREITERVRRLAVEAGADHLLTRYPGTLSGGEAQRVAMARCLAVEPRCLLLDEPLVALDGEARAAMRSLLRKVKRKGLTVIHVTHDYEEAISLASHVGILEAGRMVQVGSPRQVFQDPKTPFVARFTGFRNCFAGRLTKDAGHGKAVFVTQSVTFVITTEDTAGTGHVVLRGQDVSLSRTEPPHGTNALPGTVVDLIPAPEGDEVIVDTGVEISALLPHGRAGSPKLVPGDRVWVAFAPAAARFIKD